MQKNHVLINSFCFKTRLRESAKTEQTEKTSDEEGSELVREVTRNITFFLGLTDIRRLSFAALLSCPILRNLSNAGKIHANQFAIVNNDTGKHQLPCTAK